MLFFLSDKLIKYLLITYNIGILTPKVLDVIGAEDIVVKNTKVTVLVLFTNTPGRRKTIK